MFVNIDEIFFIKKKITQNKLKKCISIISNQKNSKIINIKRIYESYNLKKINFPPKISEKNIDIVVRTKLNKDYKYINLDKSLILCKENKKIKSTLKKVKYFKVDKIKFFPKTYLLRKTVFQKLARGKIYIPNNLSEFSPSLLNNIAFLVNKLSLRNNSKITVSTYLNLNKFDKKVDKLNSKIISVFTKFLKKNPKETIRLSLTHGDFKFEHLFLIKGKLEYVIDWDCIGIRSIFFDVMNFFIPWFQKRSYDYFETKEYILKFIKKYVPSLQNDIQNNYEVYFSIYALERYKRIQNGRTAEFNIKEANKRYNDLFKQLSTIKL